MCTSVWQDGKAVRMSNYEKQRILEASRQVSEDAQRVLALARKTLKSPYEDDVENKMCFIGFVGLMDRSCGLFASTAYTTYSGFA